MLKIFIPIVILAGVFLPGARAQKTEPPSPVKSPASVRTSEFGPTLLKIGTRYSISYGERQNILNASDCGFVDLNGKVVLKPQWKDISDFWEGVAFVQSAGKPQGWIDKTGRLFQPPPLSSQPEFFHNGLSQFLQAGKWGYVDTKGTVVIQPEWEEAREFYGQYTAVKRGGKWGGIDKTGRLVIPLEYEGLYFVPELGLWQLRAGGKSGFVDVSGRVVIKPEWDDIGEWSEGLAWVTQEGKAGSIDKTGKVVVPLEWDEVGAFREGLAPVVRDQKWGYVDKTGKVVIQPQWEAANGFYKGLAAAQRNGKWGFIDKSGKVVIEPQWDEVEDPRREMVLVRENKKFGFIDRTGRIVIEPQWDTAEAYWETRWDRALDETELLSWLVARGEKKPEPSQGVHVVWLDSHGKQIWSSTGANKSENSEVSPSPQQH